MTYAHGKTKSMRLTAGVVAPVIVFLAILSGCQTTGPSGTVTPSAAQARLNHGRTVAIRRMACLFDQRPWLNLDAAGDRDPEGVWYRAFLDPGTGKGVHAEGHFHIEMYMIERTPDAKPTRTLVSDWHYPSSAISRIKKPGMLGDGYVLQLRWAHKSVAGSEIEIITRFEDALGNVTRAGTKRLRVPKYES